MSINSLKQLALPALALTLAAPFSQASTASLEHFEQQVKPLLEQYCVECHGPDKQKADLRIDTLDPDMIEGEDGDYWFEVLDVINLGEMPPKKAEQFKPADLENTITWISNTLGEAAKASQGGGDELQLKRLSKHQYVNTLSELLQFDVSKLAETLPDDGLSDEGFDNHGHFLNLGPSHFDAYRQIAKQALTELSQRAQQVPTIYNFRVDLGRNIDREHSLDLPMYWSTELATPYHYKVTELKPEKDFAYHKQDLDLKGNYWSHWPYPVKDTKGHVVLPIAHYTEYTGVTQDVGSTFKDDGLQLTSLQLGENGIYAPYVVVHSADMPTEGKLRIKVKAYRDQLNTEQLTSLKLTAKDNLMKVGVDENLLAKQNAAYLAADDQRAKVIAKAKVTLKNKLGAFTDTEATPYIIEMYQQAYKAATKIDAPEGTLLAHRASERELVMNTHKSYGRWRYDFDVPVAGYYQSELIHAAGPNTFELIHGDGLPARFNGGSTVREFKFAAGDKPRHRALTLRYYEQGKHSLYIEGNIKADYDFVHTLALVPTDAAAAEQALAEFKLANSSSEPYMGLFYGKDSKGQPQAVTGTADKPQTLYFDLDLDQLDIRDRVPNPPFDEQSIAFLNQAYTFGLYNATYYQGAGDALNPMVIQSIEVEGPFYQQWPPLAYQQIFAAEQQQQGFWSSLLGAKAELEPHSNEAVTARIEKFLAKAFRRAPEAEEVDDYFKLYSKYLQAGEDPEHAMVDTLASALSSPSFLYHQVVSSAQSAQLAFAHKLSYLLWNQPADQELSTIAQQGRLFAVLDEQIERLLAAPQAEHFVRHFTDQWLRLDEYRLRSADVNAELYPSFSPHLVEDIAEEPYQYMLSLLREDSSLNALLSADFAVLNENLANYYGIKGVNGPEFRRVKLQPEHGRGGLLTQASMLIANGSGSNSHPIKRGVWLTERLLDDPPPPPPPNVPVLEEENPELARLDVKALLEHHQAKPGCASCHAKIDPWGIAMEGYDAAGLIRDQVVELLPHPKDPKQHQRIVKPLISNTVLPDGTAVAGMQDLQRYLIEQRSDDFNRALSKFMMSYALGRSLTFKDDAAVQEVIDQAKGRGEQMTLRKLLTAVVTSPLFMSGLTDTAQASLATDH